MIDYNRKEKNVGYISEMMELVSWLVLFYLKTDIIKGRWQIVADWIWSTYKWQNLQFQLFFLKNKVLSLKSGENTLYQHSLFVM